MDLVENRDHRLVGRRHSRLACGRLDEIGAVIDGQTGSSVHQIGRGVLTRFEDHLQQPRLGGDQSNGVDHRRRVAGATGEERSVGQHEVDLVCAVGQRTARFRVHRLDVVASGGKVHHCGHPHP
ncbi:MAG: hypothetical protein FD127_4086 [Acidimicrobiaceae bacterium]|nr:MAG: hypothetical protein FD127_4086 [Acidimicrobiaceae bacterium]